MTTEGDGNYQLQRFLEAEGAECDIQFVTAWLLYMLWEGRYDTKQRAELRGVDDGAQAASRAATIGKKLVGLCVADMAVRAAFQTFAHADRLLRLPPARHGRGRRGRARATTTTTCAAAKATWRSAS